MKQINMSKRGIRKERKPVCRRHCVIEVMVVMITVVVMMNASRWSLLKLIN